jgi:hypothetical protein
VRILLAGAASHPRAVVVTVTAMAGLASVVLGVAISLVRRRRQALGFRHASMALLGER